VKQRFKHFLKRYPAIYRFVETIYHALGSSVLGRALTWYEREWAARPLSAAEEYWGHREHPSRKFLVERIANFSTISSILEVGCNSGPNLYLIAKKFPNAEIRGIDINPVAVQYGNMQFAQEGISNVKLLVSKADQLGQFHDRSFDIVFTSAVLVHISPDKIKEVINGMIRVTRQALILMEWHCFEPQSKDPYGLGVYHGNIRKSWRTWKRDYIALLKQFVPEERIRVIKIPEGVWPGEPWDELGAVIEVVM